MDLEEGGSTILRDTDLWGTDTLRKLSHIPTPSRGVLTISRTSNMKPWEWWQAVTGISEQSGTRNTLAMRKPSMSTISKTGDH